MERLKYPRTPHVPWSQGATSDDKIIDNMDLFIGKQVVVTEKMDGENTTIYSNYCHARSIDSKNHPSRNWLKNFIPKFQYKIPPSIKVCGENLYATHSIYYSSLPSYFLAFGVCFNDRFVPWDETLFHCGYFGLETVPVLYEGIYNEQEIKKCFTGESKCGGEQEGYVIRLADGFLIEDFHKSCAKFVRKNHVQTDNHWTSGDVKVNGLKNINEN